MISEAEKARFAKICAESIKSLHTRDGIGTLKEKSLHNILKHFVRDDGAKHEIRVSGSKSHVAYVADVLDGKEVFEIQTGPLYPLRDKIAFYLSETDFRVTVVHPLIRKKRINYLDSETGSTVKRSHSSKKERTEDILPLIYPLLRFVGNERFGVTACLLDTEEFRILDGKTGRYKKYDCVPTGILDAAELRSKEDYGRFLPPSLPRLFTAKEFGKASGFRGIDRYSVIKVLEKAGTVKKRGFRGKASEYEIVKNTSRNF